ncbi:MAG: DinB family protein [Cytophagales bacterium]
MKKSEIDPMPQFFDRYINLVNEDDLIEALSNSLHAIETLEMAKLQKIGDKAYQPGKWSIKDIFQHMIDNERVQTYRAMRFARNDKTILPGYDEELFGKNSFANERSLESIVNEFTQIRKSSILLFHSFDRSVFQNSGICFNIEISVTALGFQIIGHQIHHLNVIKDQYFPLINEN